MGYIYVRHEYPLACKNAETAITAGQKGWIAWARIFWVLVSILMWRLPREVEPSSAENQQH